MNSDVSMYAARGIAFLVYLFILPCCTTCPCMVSDLLLAEKPFMWLITVNWLLLLLADIVLSFVGSGYAHKSLNPVR